MEHFSEQSWIDEVRGLVSSQGLPAHLATGCVNCASAGTFWQHLQLMATDDGRYAPPQDLVRLAKLQFAPNATADKWTSAISLFDSLLQPTMAGVRGGMAAARQMIYEAEGLTVDLRLDRTAPSRKMSIVGQILDNRVPPAPLVGAPAVLWTEEGMLVATTEANRFGEFQLEFEPQDRLRLTARVGGRRVQIPLANLK
jgi:hypothetical protein